MSAFTIQCTTCRRSLRVTNPEAIGQILSCPKCGSMVLVEAPSGWTQTAAAVDGPVLKSADLASAGKPAIAASQAIGAISNSAGVVQASTASAVSAQSSAPEPTKALEQAATKPAATAPAGDAVAPQLAAHRSNGALKAQQQGPRVAADRSSRWKHPPKEAAPPEPVAAALPAPTSAEAAAAHLWPKWFWPGVAMVLALSGMILTVRMFLRSGANQPQATVAADSPTADSSDSTDQKAFEDAAKESQPPLHEPILANAGNQVGAAPPPDDAARTASAAVSDPAMSAVREDAKTAVVEPAQTVLPTPDSSVPPPLPRPDVVATEGSGVTASSVPPPVTDRTTTEEAHPGPQRTLQRVPPRIVNVATRLTTPIRGVEVRSHPLADFLVLVSDLSTIPITLDVDAVLEMGQSPSTPVSVKLGDTTVADVLDAVLKPLKVGYNVRDGQLIVGYQQAAAPRQVRYTVSDLAADDKALGELAALVRRMIAPESWQQAGGKVSMVAGNGALLVTQSESAHAQILMFCEKLRVARGLPIKSRLDPARFVLNSREDKAHELLDRPLSANFATPQPLSGAVKWLHDSTGATILVNHAALAEQAMSDDSECTGAVVKKPFAALLDELTASAELAWRAIDEKTIEITTRPEASRRMDVEFYPIRSLAADAAAAERLIVELKSKVEPQAWGDASDKAALHFDASSRALIVCAPQRLQARVEQFVGSRAKN